LLGRDEGARDRLNRAAEALLVPVLPAARSQLSQFIAGVVASWDAREVTDKIELRVGRDLQYVRMNGTLVGALVGGALFALLMLWAMWWTLFADRSRGERRCPRCWHLMDAAVGLRCSECGLQVKHERALFATRRRWRLAALALAALVAGTVYLRFTIANDGWWTLLPNRALLTMLPWLPADGDAGDVRSELRSRLAKGLVSERDCLRMLEMVRDGDATAPAGSDLWMRTYGGWLDALRNRWASADPDDALRLATMLYDGRGPVGRLSRLLGRPRRAQLLEPLRLRRLRNWRGSRPVLRPLGSWRRSE
jgi:hypothetical protein